MGNKPLKRWQFEQSEKNQINEQQIYFQINQNK